MRKKLLIFFFLFPLFFSLASKASVKWRISLSQVICTNKDYSICSITKVSGDSVFFKEVCKPKNRAKELFVVRNELTSFRTDNNQYYLIITSHNDDNYYFLSFDKDENIKNELLKACRKIREIESIKDISKKIREYQKWTFSLGNSRHEILKGEGLYEWVKGIGRYLALYENSNNISEGLELPYIDRMLKYGIISEKDIHALFSIFRHKDCLNYYEWQLCDYFILFYKKELNDFIYTYLEKYLSTDNNCYILLRTFDYLRMVNPDTKVEKINNIEYLIKTNKKNEAIEFIKNNTELSINNR